MTFYLWFCFNIYVISGGLLARTEPILVQEKYLIRFLQALLYLGGFRTEEC